MPLYDVTFPKEVLVDPVKMEDSDIVQKIYNHTHTRTFKRMLKTIDDSIDSLDPAQKSQLVWTKAGALFGHSSSRPHRLVQHLWDNVIAVVGDDKECLIGVGSLMRWRMALRPETWLVYRQDIDEIDLDTGRTIRISEYWVNENYVPSTGKKMRSKKVKATTLDIKSLANKFNRSK